MVVQVPKNIYSYEHKVAGNLTKRQLICGIIGLVIIFPIFIVSFQKTGNSSLAGFLSLAAALPVLACSVVKKDGQYWDQILRYRIRQRFLYPRRRKFVMHNLYEIIEQDQKESETANEEREDKKFQKNKGRCKAMLALGKKKNRTGQHSVRKNIR